MLRVLAILIMVLSAPPVQAQDAEEVALARNVLMRLQSLSFSKGREYCGYLGLTRDGALVASVAVPGDLASCDAAFPHDIAVVASYHTHGAFDAGYYNELPSTIDVDGDSDFYMNGYIATPGGRFWFVDGRNRRVHQICGAGCLPVAPGFRKGADGTIAEQYSYDGLRRALGD